MTRIQTGGYLFEVDIEKTQAYYRTHSLCDCICCRNYYAQAREKLPRLAAFLEKFGVDIARPDEACSVEAENYIDYLSIDYTVCGRVLVMGEYEIDMHDGCCLSIVISDGFVSPNEQTGEYFTLSAMQIQLPWVLDIPFPSPQEKKSLLKRLLRK